MKEHYEELVMEVTEFDAEDIIRLSFPYKDEDESGANS